MHSCTNSSHSAVPANPDAGILLLADLLRSLRFFTSCKTVSQLKLLKKKNLLQDSLEAGYQFICAKKQWEMSPCFGNVEEA